MVLLTSEKLQRAQKDDDVPFRVVDLSMHPSDPRGTFPGLPTHRQLKHPAEILNLLIDKAPSSLLTGYIGFGAGALWAMCIRTAVASWQRYRQGRRHLIAALCVTIASGILLVLLHKVLRKRLITAKPHLSTVLDVSGSQSGPCRVVCSALSITNSHAGTHADTPFHFCRSPQSAIQEWDAAHYNGSVVVLDISPLLVSASQQATPKVITRDTLLAAGEEAGLSWNSVRRLILRTNKAVDTNPSWTSDFAHFDLSGAQFLAELPNLLLIAIDTPSVDHVSQSPICDGAHGVFFDHRVAIMENLVIPASLVQSDDSACSVVQGTLLTCFHPTQEFDDSKGCTPMLLL
eukprot:CAMPEP_0176429826 /NCGR_PEP_ID=MMETSP0127-20121128/13921_1 /TAXON_ID=938130 /ORGANISM="Platyophrya macrostoma, Strain WH" /LENGTH=345 /DNA_ID=CAMNT_0017811663 /DNA_START=37 /DNA_END=1074 /DNA_ORIENTATION=+